MSKPTHIHTVVVSSTRKDLSAHCEAARDAVWKCSMHALMMERDTAWDGDPVEYSLHQVDQAEVYVGIFAHRYGKIPPNSDISITEMEYRRAVKRGIPRLIFIMDEKHPGPEKASENTDFYEQDPENKQKLDTLKTELMTNRFVGFFNSVDDLRHQVFQALSDPKLREHLVSDGLLDKKPSDTPVPRLKSQPDTPHNRSMTRREILAGADPMLERAQPRDPERAQRRLQARQRGAGLSPAELAALEGVYSASNDDKVAESTLERSMTRREILAETDPMLEEAIKLVVEAEEASAKLIQRWLGIGYPRAARLMDLMEELDIIGAPRAGGRTREVLYKPDDEMYEEAVEDIRSIDDQLVSILDTFLDPAQTHSTSHSPWDEVAPIKNKKPESIDDDNVDEMYEEAVEVVRGLRKASVSLLQRQLRIGYTRAARLIDAMEKRGVVGPAERGSKPRKVIGYSNEDF